jgi:hypothetical protein
MTGLAWAAVRLCNEYFTRPDFRTYVRDHYSDVDKAMVALRDSDKTAHDPGTEDMPVALVAEIRDGGNYLLGTTRAIPTDIAERMLATLGERFPNSTFAIAGPDIRVQVEATEPQTLSPDPGPLYVAAKRVTDMYDASPDTMQDIDKRYPALHWALEHLMLAVTAVAPPADLQPVSEDRDGSAFPGPARVEPHAVRLNDLVAAIGRARSKARETWQSSSVTETKVAYYGAAFAMELLSRELTRTEPDPAAVRVGPILGCSCQWIDVGTTRTMLDMVPGLKDPSCPKHGCRCAAGPGTRAGELHADRCPMSRV